MNTFSDRPRFGPLPYIFGALLGVSLGLIIVSGVLFFKSSKGDETGRLQLTTSAAQSDAARTASIDESRRNAIVTATEQVAPAVVSVAARFTRVYRTPSYMREWLRRFYGLPPTFEKEYSSLGSGVIIDPDGYILTNAHVLRDAEDIEVTLSDGQTVEGRIAGFAPDYDLALIKIEGSGFPSAKLGDSDELLVGEWAIAIGQPFGQFLYDSQPTVTVGVISALHRDVKENPNAEQFFKDMIQTDAAINPGNSGGPLVNSRGEVIGINTFIFSTGNGGSLGMGFAIPINRGKWVLEEINRYGRVRDAWTGLHVRAINPQLAVGLNLVNKRGLLVRSVDAGSPSEKAGLRPGDLVIAVNGISVATLREANRIIFGSRIGDEIVMEIEREGKTREVHLTLEEKKDEI